MMRRLTLFSSRSDKMIAEHYRSYAPTTNQYDIVIAAIVRVLNTKVLSLSISQAGLHFSMSQHS